MLSSRTTLNAASSRVQTSMPSASPGPLLPHAATRPSAKNAPAPPRNRFRGVLFMEEHRSSSRGGKVVETFGILLVSFGLDDARSYAGRRQDHLLLQPYHDVQRVLPTQGEVGGPKSFEKLLGAEPRGEGDRVAGALRAPAEAL